MWAIGELLFRAFFAPAEPVLDPSIGAVRIPPHSNERLRDLVARLLCVDASQRLGAVEAQRHPYFLVSAAGELYRDRLVLDEATKLELFDSFRARVRRRFGMHHWVARPAPAERPVRMVMVDGAMLELPFDPANNNRNRDGREMYGGFGLGQEEEVPEELHEEEEDDVEGEEEEAEGVADDEHPHLRNHRRHRGAREASAVVEIVCARANVVRGITRVLERTPLRQLVTSPLRVQYTDMQLALDAGGLTADLYTEFFLSILRPEEGLFECPEDPSDAPASGSTYLPRGDVSSSLLPVFNAIGAMVCKALLEGRPVPCRFAPSVFAFLLAGVNAPVGLRHLEQYDRTKAMNLRRLLVMNNVEDAMGGLDFAGTGRTGAAAREIVTDDNKHEYVREHVWHLLVGSRRAALEQLRDGFANTVSLERGLRVLNASDLQRLVCGDEHVSVDDVLSQTDFVEFSDSSVVPRALPRLLHSLSQADLRRWLRLATSQCAIPRGGFHRRITVRATRDTARLPVGHTCSHVIDMPDYETEERMRERVLKALEYVETAGFELV
jgi:hypothetical protein